MLLFARFKNTVFFMLLTSALLIHCSKPDDDTPITVNEEIYINEVYASSGEDWIELYNNNAETKDISGYRIYDDEANKYRIPDGTSIPGKGFLVLLCDDLATELHTNFKLSSDGETVFIENKIGKVTDKVTFPALQDGQSYGRYPDGSISLKISGSATQGTSNGTTLAPGITSVSHEPIVPKFFEDVSIHTELAGNVAVTSVIIYYRINGSGAFTAVTMSLSSGHYHGTIPALNGTGKVEYYVEAESTGGKKTRDPFNAPEKLHGYLLNTDPLPSLKINEFLAYNSSCCPDNASGTPEYDDWIEIYNAGSTAIDIGGMHLSDDKTNPFKSKIPTTNPSLTTIQPGGFLVIWADDDKSQGELHVGFKLSNAGEEIGLYYIDGRAIDEYTFVAQSENVAWGRSTDGGATWKVFPTPTPGKSNQ
jgi:hypothetical protein